MNNTQGSTEKKILILGGTGKTGSRVAHRLTQRNWPIRIGSRSGEPAFDWLDQATWELALQDIHTVYITFQPDLAVPGAVDSIRSFAETAVKNGTQKLVLLSGRGEEEAEECEQAVMNSGAEWTILRASWFCQNFSEGYLLDPILGGYMALPVRNIGEPFIDVDDIADVAVTVLAEAGHTNQLYELTGPRLLTFEEAIREIATTTGQSIQYEQISGEAYVAALTEYGVPNEYITLLTYLFTEVMDGRNATVANGVEQVLDRKPTDFAEFIHKTVASGIWATR
ncbi:NAD(P)H-binding protein [Spirosoma endbachense]|uniref:NAD(P)H-binding protein n=2 Tax=Spirosoma endbachense TaxID=2666025 RepID=A0A6P1WAS6_9BACT|nr:NAD(P)H-binding protein [Spirosoma endbachense]